MNARRQELLERAVSFEGRSLGDLAQAMGTDLPESLRRKKGAAGELLELAVLQRRAPSSARVDDAVSGIEIKSVPVDAAGAPIESTFVAAVSCEEIANTSWNDCSVREKLACVLWVPLFEHEALSCRVIGRARIRTLDARVDEALARDWEQFSDRVNLEGPAALTAHLGRCMQVRPKAASASVTRRSVDADGVPIFMNPRGIYLRRTFVSQLLV